MTNGIKLLILDILKPIEPPILEYAQAIAAIDKSYSVSLRVEEIDEKTETVEVIVIGDNINFKKIEEKINKLGGTVHSLDEVSEGKQMINSKDFSGMRK
ncbi:DUF211 domain-containing protein [Candidatus Woesearchaeota archaeon]|nr:DUF211 domain-containing protein [Candidatus Woesearchaeota archaeon]